MKTLGCFKYSKLLSIFLAITFLFCTITINTASCAEATEMKGGYPMLVGDFEVIMLSDGINQRPVVQQSQLLQGNREKIKDVLERAYPDGKIEGTVNAFLINTGSKLVLIDTGNGKMGSPTMGNVIDNLRDETPLMWIDKAATWALAHELGEKSGTPNGGTALVNLIIEHTHTCYLGDREHRHAWGYGCGACPACELRARGYGRFSVSL